MIPRRTSKPTELLRYRYLVILIVVMIIISLTNGGVAGFKVNGHHIRFRLLIIYTVVIIGLLLLMMEWHVRTIEKIESNSQLTDDEKREAIHRLNHVWSVAHFLFYLGLGILMPKNWGLILILQVAWELFEDFLGYNLKKTQYIETDGKKMSDIVVNSLGYFIGSQIVRRFAQYGKAVGPGLRPDPPLRSMNLRLN